MIAELRIALSLINSQRDLFCRPIHFWLDHDNSLSSRLISSAAWRAPKAYWRHRLAQLGYWPRQVLRSFIWNSWLSSSCCASARHSLQKPQRPCRNRNGTNGYAVLDRRCRQATDRPNQRRLSESIKSYRVSTNSLSTAEHVVSEIVLTSNIKGTNSNYMVDYRAYGNRRVYLSCRQP